MIYQSDYPFHLDWYELPPEWREEKLQEVQTKLIEQEKDHYAGDAEELGYESEEEYLKEEIWTLENVEDHITNHFPVYF